MGDILATSVWNRVMIADLGIPAWPVGLLIALRYLLSPLSLWAGHRSDSQAILGYRRTPYIWFGRLLMVCSFPLLGASLNQFSHDPAGASGWVIAFLCFLMYGVGTLISGSPFLALVRDSAPKEKQGLAIGLVEMVLITFFPIAAISFGRWMEHYNPAGFWQLVSVTMLVGGGFWFLAIVGVEKRDKPGDVSRPVDVWGTAGRIWQDSRPRLFFIFLSLATFSAWMQDNILEPFGGEVFGLTAGQTTRFTGYWGSMTVIILLISFYAWRKRRPENQATVARIGLWIMAGGMACLAAAGFGQQRHLLELALLIFGTGFGFYTFGGLSLMAAMSPEPHSGSYLGLWTISVLIFKGLGTFTGGLLRDLLVLGLGLPAGTAYAIVFMLAAAGLTLAPFILATLNVPSFARDTAQPSFDL